MAKRIAGRGAPAAETPRRFTPRMPTNWRTDRSLDDGTHPSLPRDRVDELLPAVLRCRSGLQRRCEAARPVVVSADAHPLVVDAMDGRQINRHHGEPAARYSYNLSGDMARMQSWSRWGMTPTSHACTVAASSCCPTAPRTCTLSREFSQRIDGRVLGVADEDQ